MHRLCVLVVAACVGLAPAVGGGKKAGPGVSVDKGKRLIRVDAKVAPRKINDPRYVKIYPIEVIACWPFPKGQKAHETVITTEVMPRQVHAALINLGLKAGAPVLGESKQAARGPACKLYLELPGPAGTVRKVPLDRTLVDRRTGKPFPKTVKWLFTGSVMTRPDPTKNKAAYGADLTGTLVTIFPVTNQCVFQSDLPMKYEHLTQLETNSRVLPPVGTAVKLVIEAPPAP
jgi:hypothetical protein